MKENPLDNVKAEVDKRHGLLRKSLHDTWGKTKPFNKEPVDNDLLEYVHDHMSSAALGDLPDPNDPTYIGDMEYAIETYGRETVNQFMMDVAKRKNRR